MLYKHTPFLVAVIVFALLLIFNAPICRLIVLEHLTLDGLYTAIFDWSAIQTGFLFGVFGFVVGKKDGFQQAIAKTQAMKQFISELKTAIAVGFALTIFSMPMIAFPLTPAEFDLVYIWLSFWVALFIWAFILFCRVAYKFGVLVRVPDSYDRLAH